MKIKLLSLSLFSTLLASSYNANAFIEVKPNIVGGSESTPYSRPYQVALLMNGRQGCGGTLISKDWVLTAAHCLDNASTASLTVRVGAHSISRNDGQTIAVSQIINHEYWRGANGIRSGYDIGLLRLASPASSEYTPAKLPTQQIEQTYADVGDRVTVSGWGLTYNQGSPSDVLREVQLPVISNSSCSSQLNYNIPNSVICGGGTGGVSACNGDSGGPYAVKVGNDFYSIGTVSWGIACSGATAFTRTTSYLDWIKQKTGISDDTNDNAPTANFSFTINGLTTQFSDSSSDDNGINSYQWDFGDGSSSQQQNPSHQYQQAGTYTVKLTVVDTANQSNSLTKSVTVSEGNQSGCDGLTAWSSTQSYALGDKVSFNGRKYEATWWSTGAQPDVYSNVWRDSGTCGTTGGDQAPNADFSFSVSGSTVQFSNLSSDDNSITSVDWRFGDGNTSQATSPSHSYAVAGTYTVTLTVVDSSGQTDSISKTLTITDGNQNNCQAPTWDALQVYFAGDQVSLNNKVYQANWWTQGENPEQTGQWGAWSLVGQCQ
ncbi:trypsin-like serine protease [Pseudoalteromonas sp.]|uniref:trypsin-like serine protease n=1 Tax=Pseudoalteromonas sp. TaxID=53249 RepID=UPI0035619A4E